MNRPRSVMTWVFPIRMLAVLSLGTVLGCSAPAGAQEGPAEIPADVEEQLRSGNPAVRVAGVRAVARIGGKNAAECLIDAADNRSPVVREAVYEGLVELGPDAVGLLWWFLFHQHEYRLTEDFLADKVSEETGVLADLMLEARTLAKVYGVATMSRALVAIGRPSADHFASHIVDRDYTMLHWRMKALRCLDELPVQPLLELLSHDDEYVRTRAANKLMLLERKEAVQPLIHLVLNGTIVHARVAAARALGVLDDPAAKEPLRRALASSKDIDVAYCMMALGRLGDRESVPAIVARLSDEDPFVRKAAADALGDIGGSAAVEALKDVVDDVDDHVRYSAKIALAKVSDEPDVEGLMPMLSDFSGTDYDGQAAPVLARIGGERAARALLKAFEEGTGHRAGIAGALGTLKVQEAVGPIMHWLENPDTGWSRHGVRSCILALARIGDPKGIDLLLKALDQQLPMADTVPPVRRALVKYYAQEAAVEAFQLVKVPRAVDGLIRALEHEDPYIACQAAIALGKQGDPKAVGPLKKAMARPIPLLKRVGKEAIAEINAQNK